MNNRKYAYIRVSSRDRGARQLDAMLQIGIDEQNIYVDKKSVSELDFEQFQRLKRILREGDILYISDLNQLGHNKEGLAQEWREITIDIGAHIVVLNMQTIDTTTFKQAQEEDIKEIIAQLLTWFAADTRRKIVEAQKRGLNAARGRGKKVGRRPTEITEQFIEVYERWKAGEITTSEARELTKLKKTTFYNLVKRYEERE